MTLNLSRRTRQRIYLAALALVPLLVAYGAITEDTAPLWVALIGAILSPSLALANLTPDQAATDE